VYRAADGNLVAIGRPVTSDDFDPDLTLAWRSSDGEGWEPIKDWSAPDGLVVHGTDRWLLLPWCCEEPQAGEIPIWESADGYSWTLSGIGLPEGTRAASVWRASTGEDGFAAVACPQQQNAAAWDECRTLASEDGLAWEVSDPLPGWWWHVVSHDGEWRAVSWGERPADPESVEGNLVRIWRSEDAVEWVPLSELPVTPDMDGRLYATLADAGPVLVLSQVHPTFGIRAWSSFDGGVTWDQDGPPLNTVLASLTYEGVTILAATMEDGPIVFWVREE
jgi:hypothetical protein